MERQNVLLLLVDQWPALSFGHRGASIGTPNTDQLASAGTVFTNAFTSCPLCSPARGALLTSRWPCQTGVYDNFGIGYSIQPPLSMDEPTWIDAAVDSGYHVGYFGKWHLGYDGPIQRGAHRHLKSFDRGFKVYDPETSDYSYERAASAYVKERERLMSGNPPFWGILDAPKEETAPFRLAGNGQDFLNEYASGITDEPFFLTVSINPPHFPHYLPKEYAKLVDLDSVELPPNIEDDFANKPDFHAKPWWPSMDTSGFDETDWRRMIAFSMLHISLVDEAIGKVLNTLEANNLDKNTIVVFTSDHGDMRGAHNRFDKGAYFYEEVWRIPLIVRAPGMPHAEQDAFVSILDVGETLFRCVQAQDNPDKPRAGRDIMPLVGTSDQPQDWVQEAFGVYDAYNGMSFAVRAIRTERYKYIWNLQSVNEFYDLQKDPDEMVNLSTCANIAPMEQKLRGRLFDWMESVGDDRSVRVEQLPPAGTILATNRMGP
ncbi:sulfatase-like hydrolase/transferase [Candidatus Poribacteria bacterium]